MSGTFSTTLAEQACKRRSTQVKSAAESTGLARHLAGAARKLAPLARLSLFLGSIAVGVFAVGFVFLQSIVAGADEGHRGTGADAMEYPGAPHEPARQVVLNGAPISFRTQTVDASAEEVLDYYESSCLSRNAGIAAPLSVQSARNEQGGYVACLDTGGAPADLRSLASRLIRFARTGNLAAMGGLRYARVRRGPDGDASFLFAMWADSGLDLFRMLPTDEADSDGSDPIGVPRPPGSQRLLSAWESEQPSRVFVYRTPRVAGELDFESFYRAELSKNGWKILERHPSETRAINGVRMLSAERAHRTVTVLSKAGASAEGLVIILATEPPTSGGFRP